MMAAEPTADTPADISASLGPQLVSDAENGHLEAPAVNGIAESTTSTDDIENKRVTSVEDRVTSADVSVSGGSDTEASRPESVRLKDGGQGHLRTSSTAKKPATFKAVSVNKTFLASKAGTTSPSPKIGDKTVTGSSTPPTGSATLSARPRLVAKTGSGTGSSTPRLSSSVNGGKPAAAPDASAVWNRNRPPEPKKLTDEELETRGIHMASRLNEDDVLGQNKWADLDDDDEDWAPEAITWGDGTKTTLPHPDEQPAFSEGGSVNGRDSALDKPTSPPPPGPTAASLSKSSGLASGRGLVLKNSSQEKPTLVAKPPAPPAPAKSPWAALPPVDSASPAEAVQQMARSAPYKDSSRRDMGPPPKEIAADDFSRSSWRDGMSYGNKELFNSQSGRYEPAPERRGSTRAEGGKHPSLLQRLPQGDQPAEPSSAFQTNRTQDGSFARRRASSNVSGGSGAYFQRLAKGHDGHGPPSDVPSARRPSMSGMSGSAGSPISQNAVPAVGSAQPRAHPASGWVPRSSPGASFATPLQQTVTTETGPAGASETPAQPVVDPVEYQEKLMRESRELARKRRQEQEAQAEAEKQERIRKKLEALGPAPVKNSDKKDATAKEDTKPKTLQIQRREQPQQPAQGANQSDGQPQAAPTQGTSTSRELPKPSQAPGGRATGPTAGARRLSHGQDGKLADPWSGTGPRPERNFASWAHGAQPSAPRSVWGAPDNDRGLGNGTFNPDLSRVSGTTGGQQPSTNGPSPIAPPSAIGQPAQDRSTQRPAIGSRATRYNTSGSEAAAKWVNAVAENDRKTTETSLADRQRHEEFLASRGMTLDDAQPIIKDTWRQVHVPGDGTRRDLPVGAAQPASATRHEPWKGSAEELARGSVPARDAPPPVHAGVIGSGSGTALPHSAQGTPSQARPSRFFPARDVRTELPPPTGPPRPWSPSPPPPTMEGHPAYEGDVMRPHVSLPKPRPVVNLPPSMAAISPPTQARQHFGWASPQPFRDSSRATSAQASQGPSRHGESSQEMWQDRINNLLNGGKLSPPKAAGVDPASRPLLDPVMHHHTSAMVSLPGRAPVFSVNGFRSPISKPMAEECFEEQEMGSLPQIRLPHVAPNAAWQPALAQTKPLPKKFLVQATIIDPFYFAYESAGGGNAMKINLPGMSEAKLINVPFTSSRGGGRGGHGRSGPRSRGSQGPRGAKREASNGRGDHETSASSRGARGSRGYRNRGTSEGGWGSRQASSSQAPMAA